MSSSGSVNVGYIARFLLPFLFMFVACSGNEANSGESDQIFDSAQAEANFAETFLAREQHISQCMRDEGFEYLEQPLPDAEFDGSYTVISAEEAATSGYGLAESVLISVGKLNDPEEEVSSTSSSGGRPEETPHSEAQNEALYGADGDGGCLGLAMEAFPDDFTYSDAFRDKLDESRERVVADPAYLRALDDWMRCMSEEGVEVGDFGSLYQELREEAERIRLSAEGFGSEVVLDERALEQLTVREREAALAEAICTPTLLQVRERKFREILDSLE